MDVLNFEIPDEHLTGTNLIDFFYKFLVHEDYDKLGQLEKYLNRYKNKEQYSELKKQCFQTIFERNPEYFTYQNRRKRYIKEILSKEFCLKMVKKDFIKYFPYIPEEYKTVDLCIYALKIDIDTFYDCVPELVRDKIKIDNSLLIRINPDRLSYFYKDKTKEQHEIEFSLYDYHFSSIPLDMLTEEECELFVLKNPRENYYKIPVSKRTAKINDIYNIAENFNRENAFLERSEIVSKAKKLCEEDFEKYFVLLPNNFYGKKDDSVYIKLFNINPEKYFKFIPKNLMTTEMWTVIYNINKEKYFFYIPRRNRTKEMYLEMYDMGLITFKEVPYHLRTKKMYKDLLLSEADKYDINLIPVSILDDEIIDLVAANIRLGIVIDYNDELGKKVLEKYPTLLYRVFCPYRETILLHELCGLINTGSTKEAIADKYHITNTEMDMVLEKLKSIDLESYELIKNHLSNNQNKWIHTMYKDLEILEKIILDLGPIKGVLTSEQKIKFAYLSNKYISHSLEEIYTFNNRDKNKCSKEINMFFNRVLKYNYLNSDNLLVPERKTIMFNNNWLKKYDSDKFFGVKDGKPTITRKYTDKEVELTKEVEQKVLDILRFNNIPLNTYIVEKSFGSYFNGTLDNLITEILSFDELFSKESEKKI